MLLIDLTGNRARRGRSTGAPHDRPKALRALAFASALLLLWTAAACNTGAPSASIAGTQSAPVAGTPTAPGAVSIPTGALDPFLQCMVDSGWKIVYYNAETSPPQYELSNPSAMDSEAQAREQQCQTLQPSFSWPSDTEVRQIYYRYVDMYKCLVGLGYQPDPPPSVETFIGTYRTGPWMPVDGVAWGSWSDSQLSEINQKCNLGNMVGH
jgi:hypothetical protein